MTKRERWKSAVQKVGDDCEKNSESLCSMVMIFFFYESRRMAVGSRSSFDHRREFRKPWISSWSLAADLWFRECPDFGIPE